MKIIQTHLMQAWKLIKITTSLIIIIAVSACGDSATSSDNTATLVGSSGSTPFSGTWTINANISLNNGSTTTEVNETSTVVVDGNGNTGVSATNSTGSLTIRFNGATIHYQTVLLVESGAENSGACTITFTGSATIAGSSSNAAATGSFTPRTVLCNGSAVSYTGNITGSSNTTESTDTSDSI